MRRIQLASMIALAFAASVPSCTCGGSEAQNAGVGDECEEDGDCADEQECLSFAGGYCGLEDCEADDDCPAGSACVDHTDGTKYCFLICADKSECNQRRSAGNASNCSSNVTFVDEQDDG